MPTSEPFSIRLAPEVRNGLEAIAHLQQQPSIAAVLHRIIAENVVPVSDEMLGSIRACQAPPVHEEES